MCRQIHLVNPSTGKVVGGDERWRFRASREFDQGELEPHD
jgi:hypothetical protein